MSPGSKIAATVGLILVVSTAVVLLLGKYAIRRDVEVMELDVRAIAVQTASRPALPPVTPGTFIQLVAPL